MGKDTFVISATNELVPLLVNEYDMFPYEFLCITSSTTMKNVGIEKTFQSNIFSSSIQLPYFLLSHIVLIFDTFFVLFFLICG